MKKDSIKEGDKFYGFYKAGINLDGSVDYLNRSDVLSDVLEYTCTGVENDSDDCFDHEEYYIRIVLEGPGGKIIKNMYSYFLPDTLENFIMTSDGFPKSNQTIYLFRNRAQAEEEHKQVYNEYTERIRTMSQQMLKLERAFFAIPCILEC